METEQFTFYHGTSRNSASAILNEGVRGDYMKTIGAKDVACEIAQLVIKFMGMSGSSDDEIAESFQKLFVPKGRNDEARELWIKTLPYCRGTNTGHMFDYGAFFITASLKKAYRYAIGNPYRSEFLRAIVGGIDICMSLESPLAERVKGLRQEFPRCFHEIDNPSTPVVIEFHEIRTDQLRLAEGSTEVELELEIMSASSSEGDDDLQSSFRLINFRAENINAIHDLAEWPRDTIPTPTLANTLRRRPEEWLKSGPRLSSGRLRF